MKNIVIFASGSGTNAENIILYFKKRHPKFNFTLFSNNAKAGVLDKTKKLEVSSVVFSKEELHSELFLQKLIKIQPDLIVLAGFLLQFPENIISAFPDKIINIHPALLPNYGGKGMYGMNVHRAVLNNKERYTGITIHYVNENYDEGKIIFQKKVDIEKCQTPEDIATKIHDLEMDNFPQIIEQILNTYPEN